MPFTYHEEELEGAGQSALSLTGISNHIMLFMHLVVTDRWGNDPLIKPMLIQFC